MKNDASGAEYLKKEKKLAILFILPSLAVFVLFYVLPTCIHIIFELF